MVFFCILIEKVMAPLVLFLTGKKKKKKKKPYPPVVVLLAAEFMFHTIL